MNRSALLLVLVLAACTAPEVAAPPPPIDAGATEVDLLLLRGEFRGIVPSTDMQRVKARFPDAKGIATGIGQAGLLTSEEGFAVLTDRSGGRAQAIWIEFLGSRRVPATKLASRDGRIRAGATEADVLAWLDAHGLPRLVREFPADATPESPIIRQYYIDYARAWIEVKDGRLSKVYAADRHIYGQGRMAAVSPEGE